MRNLPALALATLRRPMTLGLSIGLLAAGVGIGVSPAGDPQTYVAQCSVLDLVVTPSAWDVGCTGGSPAAADLAWTGWGSDTASSVANVRRRYDTTGDYEDRIYPLFPGRVVLTKPQVQPCRNGKRQYTHALIEWTVPDGFEYDTPGLQSAEFDIGRRCPSYLLGSSRDADGSDGLGEEHPGRIWLGGDASTVYFGIRWKNWGRTVATATGRGYLRPPYAKSVRVRIVASGRRACSNGYDFTYSKVSFRKGSRRAFVQRFARGC